MSERKEAIQKRDIIVTQRITELGITIETNTKPLIRCKDCRHSFINENHPQKPRICGLTKMCGTTKDDWFCADGEREGE